MKFYKKHVYEIWAIGLSLLVNVLVFLPHLIGFLNQDSNLRFTYIAGGFYQDEFSYFAWVKQAMEGHSLFKILFTTEAHPALIFHPVFLIIGFVQNITKIPLSILWYLGSVMANIFFLASLYVFIKKFVQVTYVRVLAFAIIVFGAGFGWATNYATADKLYSETTIFQLLRWPIIFPLALGFSVLSYFFIVKFSENLKWKNAVVAGLLGAFLIMIHPYDAVTYYVLPACFLITLFMLKRIAVSKKLVLGLLIWIILPLIPAIYYLFLSLSSSVYSYNSYIQMASGPVLEYILGFGFLLLFGVIGFFYPKEPLTNSKIFLIVWSVAGSILLYSPISFQRRLVMGLIIPLGILSAELVNHVLNKIVLELGETKFRLVKHVLVVSLVLVLFGTNAIALKADFQNVQSKTFPFYVDQATFNAFNWIDKNTPDRSVVLSSYDSGTMIPGYTGNGVYAGHWAQTIDLGNKADMITKFYSGRMTNENQKLFFEGVGIKYVYFGKLENEIANNNFLSQQHDLLEKIYDSEGVVIFKVK